MAHPRTLAEWEALTGEEALTDPERQLIEACREGEPCVLGKERPEKPDPECNIRAELLRWLILGGCDDCRVHEWGVQLMGAYITGSLDLSFGEAKGLTAFFSCRFAQPVKARQMRFEFLNLSGSALPGLDAQGAEVKGHAFLRDGFEATGAVSFAGARIGGQLACSGGRFANEGGAAFNAQGIDVKETAFLSDGFDATGEVSLSGARIGGQLDCSSGRFANEGGQALLAQRMYVAQGFLWRNVNVGAGIVNLSAAFTSDLVDDLQSWPKSGQLILDGFSYDRIDGGLTDAARRLDWLVKGDRWDEEFFPQPYTQLAKVLREMGHERDARLVLIAKERKLAAEQIRKDREKARALWSGDKTVTGDIGWHWLRRTTFKIWNGTAWRLIGYGYAPQYAFYWLLRCLIFLTVWYFLLWRGGGLVPNSPVVLNSETWITVLEVAPRTPGPEWAVSKIGQHYETFFSAFYAADVFIPLIDFGQESAWTATTANFVGWLAFLTTFAFKSFGWFLTALGAAAITGIIRRD